MTRAERIEVAARAMLAHQDEVRPDDPAVAFYQSPCCQEFTDALRAALALPVDEPAAPDEVAKAREGCANVCRNVAMSFARERVEDSIASGRAFVAAMNAGQALLAAERRAAGGGA